MARKDSVRTVQRTLCVGIEGTGHVMLCREAIAVCKGRREYINALCGRGDRGGTVVKVLCCKSEGRWFDSRWCDWNFSLP
jgi:hypothetical protein